MTRNDIFALVQAPTRAGPETLPRSATVDLSLIESDAGGAIDLAGLMTAEQRTADQAQPVNPFRLRYHPAFTARNVTVSIGGIIRGAGRDRDCCVLNNQVLRSGETFEGLAIDQISADRIVLQSGHYRLALPAGDRPITLRLPQ